MTETVDGFVWSLSGGTLTISGTGTVSNDPDWMDNPVMSKLVLGEGISGIGEKLFSDYPTLTEVALPASLTAIGDIAFAECTGLKSIDLPNRVLSIGESAFSGCSGLTSVSIPASVTTIGENAFLDCTSLQSVTISADAGLTTIGDSAFAGSGLTSITLQNCSVGSSAFAGCENLKSASLGDSTLGESAFEDCTSLSSISFSGTAIPESICSGCTSLTEIILQDGIKTINNAAFYGCINLERICIPASVESIDKEAFTGCSSKLTIFGKSGSAAEAFAKDNDITFVDSKLTKLTLTAKSYTYNGEVQKPGISSVKAGDFELGASDYEVVYSDENSKNKGTYKVTVKGRGLFTNTLKATYKIQPAELTNLTLRTVKYNGSVQNPVKVVKAGNLNLKRSDYSVVTDPAKAVNARSYQVEVTGKGNYHGTLTKTFTIKKAKNTLRVIGNKTIKVSYNNLKKQNLTYKVSKAITLKNSGQGKLSFKKAKGDPKITINKSTGQIAVKKGLKKGTYRVQMIIKAAGDKNYNEASETVKFTVWVK